MKDLLPILLLTTTLLGGVTAAAYLGWRNWTRHKQQRILAEKRGWHYAVTGLPALWRRKLTITGTTPTGVHWQLKQLRRYQQAFFEWRTQDVTLPYGTLVLKPAHPAAPKRLLSNQTLRPYPVPSELWNSEFVLLVSHNSLGQRYFTAQTEYAMRKWPRWPTPGSLEEVIWNKNGLTVLGRSAAGWELLERLVTLGTIMAEQANTLEKMPQQYGDTLTK
ncbi:MAG: hypothetical protein Kow0080_20860 [Candidatus Promineifilaceae bacterium]